MSRAYEQVRQQYDLGRLERVEEQLQALKARTDFVEEANYEDLGNGFLLARGQVSIGRSWDRLTDVQKPGQIVRSTDFVSLKPGEKKAILAREVDMARLPEETRRERDAAGHIPLADILESVTVELEAFGDALARLARTKEQKALAENFGKFISETCAVIVKLGQELGRDNVTRNSAKPAAAAS